MRPADREFGHDASEPVLGGAGGNHIEICGLSGGCPRVSGLPYGGPHQIPNQTVGRRVETQPTTVAYLVHRVLAVSPWVPCGEVGLQHCGRLAESVLSLSPFPVWGKAEDLVMCCTNM